MISTHTYFELVAPHVPARLIAPTTTDWIADTAALLPPSSNFGFECDLGREDAEADFLVAILPSDGSLGAWAGANRLSVAPIVTNPIWRRVHSLLTDWHAGDGALAPIHDTWLEFDRDPKTDTFPDPSFFFGFDEHTEQNHPELTARLTARLFDSTLSRRVSTKLQACFDALPARAVIFQVGVMLARRSDEIRLCVRQLPVTAMPTYLADLGWPGDAAALRHLLHELEPLVDSIGLDFAVNEQLYEPIGLECYLRDGAGRDRARAFLEHLATLGAVGEAKLEAVFDWLGYSTPDSEPSWPAFLRRGAAALGDDVVSTVARTLNHVKITYRPDQPLVAKAYLGVRHFWARDARGTTP